MPTYTDFLTGQANATPQMEPAFIEEWLGPVVLDFTGKVITAADVWEMLGIQAEQRVLAVNVKILTPATASALTAGFGDGGGTSKYGAAKDLTAAAGTEYESAIGTDAGVAGGDGTLYSQDDTIDLIFTTVTAVTVNPILQVRVKVRIPNAAAGYVPTF